MKLTDYMKKWADKADVLIGDGITKAVKATTTFVATTKAVKADLDNKSSDAVLELLEKRLSKETLEKIAKELKDTSKAIDKAMKEPKA